MDTSYYILIVAVFGLAVAPDLTRNSIIGGKKTYHDKIISDYGSKNVSDLRKDVACGSNKDYSSGRKAYHSSKKDYHGSTKVDSNDNKTDHDVQINGITDPKQYWN